MEQPSYYDELLNPITVCDSEGTIIYMNNASRKMLENYNSQNLIGKSLYDCHNPHSNEIIRRLLETGESNTYFTIKKGVKKLVHQTPWFTDGKISGLIEIITILPDDVQTFERG
jgi:transcriptional regulator with PAS, ATPase and Fis domain